MKYYKISEEDLIKLLRDSMTLKEILGVKPVSEDLAETELSKFSEVPENKVPEYSVPIPEKPFRYVEVSPGHWVKTDTRTWVTSTPDHYKVELE